MRVVIQLFTVPLEAFNLLRCMKVITALILVSVQVQMLFGILIILPVQLNFPVNQVISALEASSNRVHQVMNFAISEERYS